jgi:hypothetical protein
MRTIARPRGERALKFITKARQRKIDMIKKKRLKGKIASLHYKKLRKKGLDFANAFLRTGKHFGFIKSKRRIKR